MSSSRNADAPPQSVSHSVDGTVQLCGFYVGTEEYVVDLRRVEEILQPPRLTRVPRAPFFIEGVMNIRGSIVPVVDLRKRLQSGPPPSGAKAKCMVCRLGPERVAILVDAVTEVVRVRRSELRAAPPLLDKENRPYVIGVCGPEDGLKLLLDLKAVFQLGGRTRD